MLTYVIERIKNAFEVGEKIHEISNEGGSEESNYASAGRASRAGTRAGRVVTKR